MGKTLVYERLLRFCDFLLLLHILFVFQILANGSRSFIQWNEINSSRGGTEKVSSQRARG